jgi:hypothetical protein
VSRDGTARPNRWLLPVGATLLLSTASWGCNSEVDLAETADAGAACAYDMVGVQGVLDGAQVVGSFDLGVASGNPFHFYAQIADGHLVLWPAGSVDTSPVSVVGLLRMPTGPVRPGAWLCAGPPSQVWGGRLDYGFAFPEHMKLDVVGSPGTCGQGEPVPGELVFCPGQSNTFCDAGLHGSIGGAAVDATNADFMGTGPTMTLGGLTDGGFIVIVMELATATVLDGFVLMPTSGPDPGAIYCFGAATMEPATGDDGNARYTLSELRRLAPCSQAEPLHGQLDACFGY